MKDLPNETIAMLRELIKDNLPLEQIAFMMRLCQDRVQEEIDAMSKEEKNPSR